MAYSGVWRRAVAALIDGLIGLIWTLPFYEVRHVNTAFGSTTTYSLKAVPFLIVIGLWIAYFPAMEGLAGATMGKFALGLRVVRVDGGKIGLPAALIRCFGRIIDGFPYLIPYLVGAIVAWSSPTHQRIGDRWAKTVVIRAGSNANMGSGTMQPGMPLADPPPGGVPIPPPPPMPPSEG